MSYASTGESQIITLRETTQAEECTVQDQVIQITSLFTAIPSEDR